MADPTPRDRARAALKRGGLLFSGRADAAVEEVAAEIEAACAAAVEEWDRASAENRILRGLVQTNPDWKCPHGMDVSCVGKCPLGFPGCSCADDRIAVFCDDGSRLIEQAERRGLERAVAWAAGMCEHEGQIHQHRWASLADIIRAGPAPDESEEG